MDDLTKIEKFLDEQHLDLIAVADKALLAGDSPKFSATTGERRMVEKVKQEIQKIRRDREA